MQFENHVTIQKINGRPVDDSRPRLIMHLVWLRRIWEVVRFELRTWDVILIENKIKNLSRDVCNLRAKFSVASGRGSVLIRQRCDTLCTSGFVDNVIFYPNGRMAARPGCSVLAELGRLYKNPIVR